jgi:putative endonuclease
MRSYFVYVMTNQSRSTIYIGVTNDLVARVAEHQRGASPGFTGRYRLNRLVYHETFQDPRSAITREKQLKRWRREKKNALVATMNPTWKDLSPELFANAAPMRGGGARLGDPSTPVGMTYESGGGGRDDSDRGCPGRDDGDRGCPGRDDGDRGCPGRDDGDGRPKGRKGGPPEAATQHGLAEAKEQASATEGQAAT